MMPRPEGLKSLLLVVLPKLIGGVAVFALNLLIVQFVSPATFGVISFCTMVMVLFDGLIASAIDLAVLRVAPEQARQTGSGLRVPMRLTPAEIAAVWLKIGLGCLLITSALLGARQLSSRILSQAADPSVFVVVACSATAMMLLRSSQAYCQLRSQFHIFGLLEVATTLLRAGAVLALLLSGLATPTTVLASYAVAPLIPALTWLVYYRRQKAIGVNDPQPSGTIRASLFALCHVLKTMLATTLVGAIVARLDLLILSVYSNPVNVGLYGAAATIASIPELFGSYLASALTPRIVPKTKDGTFFAFFRQTQLSLYSLAALMLLVGWTVGGTLMQYVFPAKYIESIDLVHLLMPAVAAGLVTFPLTLNYLMFYSPRSFLWLDLLTAPLLIFAFREAAVGDGARSVAVVTSSAKVLKAVIVHAIAWKTARRMQSHWTPPAAESATPAEAVEALGGAA